MICRMWHGWTTLDKASAYDSYLQNELFPKIKRELSSKGYLGFHLLRSSKGAEVEFVTMLWFNSLSSVKAFAGQDYSTPVISEKAKSLLLRYADQVEHYELSGSSFPDFE
ncbi:MAG TPA: antibiotic biosynthesis monooxygenase [Terriglobales bacterium]|nr:antibiotic biosynthesis monooxygenase [Terriglobales bacterium]